MSLTQSAAFCYLALLKITVVLHQDTEYSCIYFFHTSQGVKNTDRNFALFHRILKFPQDKDFSETNGSDVEYEIQFCHQYFSVERKKLIACPA